jgi:lysophospholipid acyltransferase (LPLAT)-like uncharacterized protein
VPRPDWQIDLLAGLGAATVGLLAATCRIESIDEAAVSAAERETGGAIHAFWHGRLLLAALAHDGAPTLALISRHGDGEVIARIVARRRIEAVRGSTRKGGAEALRAMIDQAREGRWKRLAMTPDGPRGPREVAEAGTIVLARTTGFAIVPVGLSARPSRRLKSWDRFLVPAPGARVVAVYGAPMRIPSAAAGPDDTGAARAALEAELRHLTAEADRRVEGR